MPFIVHCRANEKHECVCTLQWPIDDVCPDCNVKTIFPRITNVIFCLLIQKAYVAQCACSHTLVHSLIGIKINKYLMLLLVSRSTVLHGTNKISR